MHKFQAWNLPGSQWSSGPAPSPFGPNAESACMHAKSLQLCLYLCNRMDCSSPSSSVHRILQARILGCVAMPSSRGSSLPRDQACISYASCVDRWVLYHECHLGSHKCRDGSLLEVRLQVIETNRTGDVSHPGIKTIQIHSGGGYIPYIKGG